MQRTGFASRGFAEQPDEILGFFTLAFSEIQSEDLPAKYAKKYPSKVPASKLVHCLYIADTILKEDTSVLI